MMRTWQAFSERMWVSKLAPGETQFSEADQVESTSAEKSSGFQPMDSSMSKESQEQQGPPEFHFSARHFMAFTVLMGAMAATALDYSATGNVMAIISSDSNGTTSQTEWIGNGYSLTACVFQLPISALSDIFGRRAMFMTVSVFFFVGSLICALAPNMEALIAGRVIQGVGGGGCLVLPEVILADTIPLRQRSLYYCIIMVVWCVFSGAAPMVAGASAEYASWRWFFYSNLFIIGASGLAAPFTSRLKTHDEHWRERLKKIDIGGAVSTIGSTTSFLSASSRGGSSSDLPWSHWSVILPLVLGAAGFVSTAAYEHWTKPAVPMFDFRVFGNSSAVICYIHNILQGIVNMALVYFSPTFFQGAKGYGESVSGASISPSNLIGSPTSLLIGLSIEKTGHYHLVNLAMWGSATMGTALMTTMTDTSGIGGSSCIQIPASIGVSCLYATSSTTANATNPPYLWTESTAMMSFCRAIGDALGTAVGGAIVASQSRSRSTELASQGSHIPDSASVSSIVGVIHNIENPATKSASIDVSTQSMKTSFIVLASFCAAGFVTTLMQKEYCLDQHYESKQGIDED